MKNRHSAALGTLMLLLVALLAGFSGNASALEIECENLNDPSTCDFNTSDETPGTATSFEFVQTVNKMLNNYLNNVPLDGECTRDGDIIECALNNTGNNLSQLSMICTREDENNASCQLSNLNPAYFSLSCNRVPGEPGEADGGSCTINNDRSAIRDDLTDRGLNINDNRFEIGVNLLAACATRGGTTAFQRECDTFLQALAAGDNSGAANLLAAIAPQNTDLALDMNQAQTSAQTNSVSNRMNRLRNNQRGIDVSGVRFSDGGQWVKVGDMLANNSNQANDASPPVAFADSRLGAFIDGTILQGEQGSDEFEDSADHDAMILVAGIDYRLRDDLIIGTAYRYATTEATVRDDLSKVKVSGYSLLGYLTHYRDNWYGEATLAFGSDSYSQQRRLVCGAECPVTFDVQADSDYHGDQWVATIGGGYELQFAQLSVTPNAQFALGSQKTDSYRETASNLGAVGAGYLLDIGSQTRDQQSLTLGVTASYAISTDFGIILPMLSVDLRNEMETDALAINGQFVGDVSNDQEFLVLAREVDSSYMLIGLGTSFQFQGGNSGYVQFRTIQGYDNLDQWELTAAWRWEL